MKLGHHVHTSRGRGFLSGWNSHGQAIVRVKTDHGWRSVIVDRRDLYQVPPVYRGRWKRASEVDHQTTTEHELTMTKTRCDAKHQREMSVRDLSRSGIELESVATGARCAFCGCKQDPPRLQRGTGLCLHCAILRRVSPRVVR